MKLLKIKKITGTIRVVTGLHVGGGDAGMEIGGMDNPIIRNKANGEPYIPGSSLKGKMRSLMEWETDRLHHKGDTHKCNTHDEAVKCPVCRVFGVSAVHGKMDDPKVLKLGPTRLVVRDALLSEKSREAVKQGLPITEEKSENSINRITAEANPRPVERVVPGVEFDLDITFKILDLDDGGNTDEQNFNAVVLKALALVQEDYLGGGGSRGSGKVEFINLKDEKENTLSLPTV
jgi:CRISPR-associated protein Csm3